MRLPECPGGLVLLKGLRVRVWSGKFHERFHAYLENTWEKLLVQECDFCIKCHQVARCALL